MSTGSPEALNAAPHAKKLGSISRFMRGFPEWLGLQRARGHLEAHSPTNSERPAGQGSYYHQELSQRVGEGPSHAESAPTLTIPERLEYLEDQYPRRSQPSSGFFTNASHFTVQNSVMNVIYHHHEQAMKSLASHTIRGAEFDSSARDPPPKCHPGTRKDVMERVQAWLQDSGRQKRILWFVGFAGAGKSAIMQTLAEFALSLPIWRWVFITLAYQIAIRHPSYREFVLREFDADPDLPEKAMKIQFARLIVEPFVHRGICRDSRDLLIFLDGLDECEGDRSQCEMIDLISSVSLTYPNAPLVWVIASRPESHLQPMYTRKHILKEEVRMDSDQACADVELYLREEFERIRKDDPIARTYPQWPTEAEFRIITAAAAGLFAYAATAVKFIDDPIHRNPVSGLALLLTAIGNVAPQPSKGRSHPLAHLDALYAYILSQIPKGILPDTTALLANHFVLQNGPALDDNSSVFLCNWAGMTPPDAYSALHRLHSVLTVPPPEKAQGRQILVHHQSFYEYLKDPDRSHGFHISGIDLDKQEVECCFRIIKEAGPNMITSRGTDTFESNMVLSWPTSGSKTLQRALYRRAVWSVAGVVERFEPELVLPKLQDPALVPIAKTLNLVGSYALFPRLSRDYVRFMHYAQHRLDERIRAELARLKLLQETSLRTLDLDIIEMARITYIRCECNDSHENMLDKRGIPGKWNGPELMDYDSKYKFWWFTAYKGLPQPVLQELRAAQADTRDMPVLLFGNTLNTCLMYESGAPDGPQRRTYYIRYGKI